MKRHIILSLSLSRYWPPVHSPPTSAPRQRHTTTRRDRRWLNRLQQNRVAEGGSGRLQQNRVAEGGSDRLTQNRAPLPGSAHLNKKPGTLCGLFPPSALTRGCALHATLIPSHRHAWQTRPW